MFYWFTLYREILFGDDNNLFLNGYVNKQNCSIWIGNNPWEVLQVPPNPEKCRGCLTLESGGILVHISLKMMLELMLQWIVFIIDQWSMNISVKFWKVLAQKFFLDKNFKAGTASVFGYPDQNLSDPSATKIVKLEYLSIDYFYYWVMRIQVQEVIQSWNIVKKLMNHKII